MPRNGPLRREFTSCTTGRHPSCPVRSPFTPAGYTRGVQDWLAELATQVWALPLLFALVLGDAFLVVVPGETAVTAFGALAVSTGAPPLVAVLAVAALAAFCGDVCCYVVGRRVGLDRWRWMRGARVQSAFAWARRRLDRSTGAVVFTARFVPFARLAVNLTAGAAGLPATRYLAVAGGAALAWATYQALVGAVVALLVPGGPVVALIVSIIVALALGAALDAVLTRRARARDVATARQDEAMQPNERWTGHDDDFLAVRVALPRPADGRATRELRYPRFTVLLDPARRLAVATAVDIDGATLRDLPRRGDWDLDDRVAADEQAGPGVYSANDLDRGHLVRRRDPGWGTDAEAAEATAATFFYPNAARRPRASTSRRSCGSGSRTTSSPTPRRPTSG